MFVGKRAITYGVGQMFKNKRPRYVKLKKRTKKRVVLSRVRAANRSRRNRMDIKKMKCFINSRTAIHIRRQRRAGSLTCGVNAANYTDINTAGNKLSIEGAFQSLRYFNPATNSLETKDASVGTYSRDLCLSIQRKLTVRNNYQVPVRVQVWTCRPKDATSDTALSLLDTGLADQNNPANRSPLVYVTDSKDLTNVWNVKACINRYLLPGQSAVCHANDKRFDYQISTADEHTVAFQKKQGGHNFLLRVSGIVGHDTLTAQCSLVSAGVDWLFDATYRIEYDAGKDLHDYSLDDNLPTSFANSGVVSQHPVADNQGYSVS